MRLKDTTIEILKTIKISGQTTVMPQLSRQDYVEVNKVLEVLGGKWNKKQKCHVWDCDPNEPISSAVETGEIEKSVDWKKEFQFFETPDFLAKRMVDLADIKEGMTVLEPSAGNGAILKHLNSKFTTAVEFNPDMAAKLSKFEFQKLIYGDFLALNIEVLGVFDRIIMNPPFSKGQDIAHIRHAYDFLKEGGILVGITSPGWTFRQDKKHVEFKDWIESLDSEVIDLPSGTFKKSGTMISAKMVVLRK